MSLYRELPHIISQLWFFRVIIEIFRELIEFSESCPIILNVKLNSMFREVGWYGK